MKIAISGAGVAGPTLAYWLLRAGHEPTLLESAPSLRTAGYMIDFWGVGYTVAERMGILPQLLEAGYKVHEVRFVDGDGRRAGGFSTEIFSSMMNDRFTSLPRGDLAASLYRSIEGRAETLFDTTISRIEEYERGVRVVLGTGIVRDFELLIGADGLHSNVRDLIFGRQRNCERPIGYYVAAFEAKGYRPRDELAYVSYGMPGRQISRFTQRGDCTMFLFVFAAEHLTGPEPARSDEHKATLRRIFADADWEWPLIDKALDTTATVYFDRVSQITLDSWSKGRVALIGDAAGCVSLLAGEGAGLAMTDAYVLAGELSCAKSDHRVAFRRYEELLRPFIESKQKAARSFAHSFAPRSRLGVWIRNQATKLMIIPQVANLLVLGELRDKFELPDYEM